MSARFDFVNCDRYRLAIQKGATFAQSIVIKDPNTGLPRDLTGYTSTLVLYDYCTGTTIFSPTVHIDVPSGTISASASATQTGALTAGRYRYVWSILTGAVVQRELEGTYEVTI